jgi:hypothetical protein
MSLRFNLRDMKRLSILLLVLFISLLVYPQDGYVYKNAEYGMELTFPFEPKITNFNTKLGGGSYSIFATSVLTFKNGKTLTYSLTLQKSSAALSYNWMKSYEKSSKKFGGYIKNKTSYKAGNVKVTEFEYSSGMGDTSRIKIITFINEYYSASLSVSSTNSTKYTPTADKDVLPFFNSLKIDGVPIRNPVADNSKFKAYAFDSPFQTTTDKQIVNVNNQADTIKQIVYVSSDIENSYKYEKFADVDKNIPRNTTINTYRFALIIGNEDYSSNQTDLKSESNVDFARNDASAFKEYCLATFGIPEKNITFLLDATAGQISQGISKLKLLSKASGGKSQLIVFYAGHGLPDEKTKEPYLIPVDVTGSNVTAGIKLQDLYNSLTEFPSERIMVFLDACFTGGGRNAGLVASRGVKIMPKEDVLKGNLVVFSSSSGEQSSLPYADQKHGMFTYYLLKKLQETKGDLTYSDLSKYLDEKVSIESLLVNSKEQNPVVNTSQSVSGIWKLWKVN